MCYDKLALLFMVYTDEVGHVRGYNEVSLCMLSTAYVSMILKKIL